MSLRCPDGAALLLPDPLRVRLFRDAETAAPEECCGLITGTRIPQGWRVADLIPSPNRAKTPQTAFEIDLRVQFDVQRRLRPGPLAVIGCYHSHPNGPAEPSHRDRQGMADGDLIWLIAGRETEKGTGWQVAAFALDAQKLVKTLFLATEL